MNENTISYLMLFCALILVKNSRATLEQSLSAVPLFGPARMLSGKLVREATEP